MSQFQHDRENPLLHCLISFLGIYSQCLWYVCSLYVYMSVFIFSTLMYIQVLFFGGGWVFFMRKLFKNFEVCVRYQVVLTHCMYSLFVTYTYLCNHVCSMHTYPVSITEFDNYPVYLLQWILTHICVFINFELHLYDWITHSSKLLNLYSNECALHHAHVAHCKVKIQNWFVLSTSLDNRLSL